MIKHPRQTQLFTVTHRNHYLFSDYYLNNRVHRREEWQRADATAIFATVKALWSQFSPAGGGQ